MPINITQAINTPDEKLKDSASRSTQTAEKIVAFLDEHKDMMYSIRDLSKELLAGKMSVPKKPNTKPHSRSIGKGTLALLLKRKRIQQKGEFYASIKAGNLGK